MTCKHSEQCDNENICPYARSKEYHILGCYRYTPKDQKTNKEWFRSCSDEELTEWLHDHLSCANCEANRNICNQTQRDCKVAIREWLEEKHR